MTEAEQKAVAEFTKTVQGVMNRGNLSGAYMMDINSAVHLLSVLQKQEAEIKILRECNNHQRLYSEKQPVEAVECCCSGLQLLHGGCNCGARK